MAASFPKLTSPTASFPRPVTNSRITSFADSNRFSGSKSFADMLGDSSRTIMMSIPRVRKIFSRTVSAGPASAKIRTTAPAQNATADTPNTKRTPRCGAVTASPRHMLNEYLTLPPRRFQ